MASCTYRFVPSSLIGLPTRSYELRIRQEPQRAKMSIINERDRRPIEPPPILQVCWLNSSPDEIKKNLQCPFYFMVANILCGDSGELLSTQDHLAGSTVSSLYHLRDIDDTDGGFFVFGDLFCKKQGHYRLQFNLFEIIDGQVQNRQVITSQPFRTYMPKNYPGPVEATFLSRTFSDQGVKMRIRKEHRISSGSARKRRLDVQALMDSQPELTTLKTTKLSLAAPQRHTASMDPPRIAPATHQQQLQPRVNGQDTNLHYHPSETIPYYRHQYHPQQQHSNIETRRVPTKDHMMVKTEGTYVYPSPPLLPTRSSSTCSSDDFPVTLLDEYHLQQQQQLSTPPTPSLALTFSSSSSSSSLSPRIYHASHQHDPYGNNHPDTPPLSSSVDPYDHYSPSPQHHVWGERLPALKAVMSGYTSRSAHLVLPCPFENI